MGEKHSHPAIESDTGESLAPGHFVEARPSMQGDGGIVTRIDNTVERGFRILHSHFINDAEQQAKPDAMPANLRHDRQPGDEPDFRRIRSEPGPLSPCPADRFARGGLSHKDDRTPVNDSSSADDHVLRQAAPRRHDSGEALGVTCLGPAYDDIAARSPMGLWLEPYKVIHRVLPRPITPTTVAKTRWNHASRLAKSTNSPTTQQ